ncbi:TerC family protein [Acinetobacter cumulans]|jgi:CBS domain containing-hemolysin-like protein|uniref:TerC family protein n=1 Tax=Acinetobacter cumulans TaxID=2136182 RepID=A0A3A8G5P3_9GAMM|nr:MULTISPECIES: TerC family protein [Acinetobacter]NWK72700.1 TerC family protein [Acinetobacter sp. SwsAc6]QCO20579.1 CBS domain-containing protein [Acinetobacter cumulans]RFS33381.1 TerC family protein [Acinetobacter sp. SWAC5]RKG45989.1 TerC family protein [Acinetobacter cumulans]RKG49031.1 TerC family protein [Acinetobacter cumulans]
MIFEWMSDPSAWVGLLTLVVLEIVLGIDNLVFIAILAEKLPPEQRDKARKVGLLLALCIRLVLLASIAWVMTLITPLFHVFEHPFSGRDLILLFGGVFLLFKGTMELRERLENKPMLKEENPVHATFWMVIIQIVVLDAVFSLDSVITAVGMVKQLPVMMIAVVIAVGIMLLVSKPLMNFVNRHPTVVILCLCFLMMIGFSLLVEGFGFHIPKGYLYAAIGFSVLIEFLNQTMRHNQEKMVTTTDLRYRTASAVMRMLGGKSASETQNDNHEDVLATRAFADEVFDEDNGVYHSVMVQGVLGLSERPVKSVMTPRPELEWIDLDEDAEFIREQLLSTTHSRLIVAHGELDNIAGVVLTHKIMNEYIETGEVNFEKHLREPVIVHENAQVLMVMEQMRQAPLQMAIVLNEYGSIEGIATPIDVLEAIAGEFPDEDELDTVAESLEDGTLMLDGSTDIRHVSLLLGCDLVDESEQYSTLSGYILFHLGRLPENGEKLTADDHIFEVVTMDGHKIDKVHVINVHNPSEEH